MTDNRIAPRRRGHRTAALGLLFALIAFACGGDEDTVAPGVRTPDTGAYLYEAVIQTGDSTADTLSGTLTISTAHPDSIVATWNVPGYANAPERAPWNINAYALRAVPTGPGGPNRSINHRIWRQDASPAIECQVAYERITQPADTFISGVAQNDCSFQSTGN